MSPASDRLAGKIAYVSAAAQGIGAAIAQRLAAEGARVLASDINGAQLAGLTGKRIETVTLDARDGDAVASAIGAFGPLDILVNCVGWVHHGTVLDCSPQDWSRSFALNVDTAYFAIRVALPAMLERRAGSIVNIASAASSIKGFANRAAYGASKAALIGLTKAIAVDCASAGVRCNAICPGTVDSPSLGERIAAMPDPVAARAAFIARQPMGRFGTPEEIAALAAYLGADESAFMTGATLLLDGGATA
ncbi:SDR family oxidoreductase [uncultured Devosia sp.]|uniref:SDR family oxidoreductase n=1 Tax=uncultured Devosia sp. TaxID=211434 RepID=UPI0035CA1422